LEVLYLTDTRVYKAEEIPKIEKSLGVVSGFWILGSPRCAGTAILFFMPVNILTSYNDPKERYTRVDYVWEDSEYSSLAVYAPAIARDRQSFIATDLSDFLQSKPPLEKTIIAGDWNFVLDPSLDRRCAYIFDGQVGHLEFEDLIENHDLLDLFRHYHPAKRFFIYSSSQFNMSTHIDRCYINKGALAFAHSCKHVSLPSSISVHEAGVFFTIRAINASTMGSGYRTLNASLLKRPGYKKLIESTINDFSSARNTYPDVKSWWKSLKYAIQIVIQPYAKEQNGQRKRTIDSLERQLLSVNEDLCSPTLSCPELAFKKGKIKRNVG
jgi:hypothetical protein